MVRFICLGLLWFSLIISCSKSLPSQGVIQSDVCIYGGTSAAVTAAVQLARLGKTVVIVEPSAHIGGMTVEGLGGSDINNHPNFQNDCVIGGLAREFYEAMAAHYGIEDLYAVRDSFMSWRFESSVAEAFFDQWLQHENIRLFLNQRLHLTNEAIQKEGPQLQEFRTEAGLRFQAKVFIDASYEGDLLHHAGVPTVVGREANATYGETKNGIRWENTYRQFEVAVDPYLIPGDPSSGLIHTVQADTLLPSDHGKGDERIQAFCFRACLTRDSAKRVPFQRPENYQRDWYEIYLRYLEAGGKLYEPYVSIPNGKTDLGAWHDLSHNLYGMNHAWPTASHEERAAIYQYHLDFTQGLFWFLANDPEVGETVRTAWSQWGTTRDEFTDNEGWPRQIYIRDGRRMVSEYVITELHTRKDTLIPVPDPVGVAFWPPDVHHVRRIVREGQVYNEGFVFGGNDWKPFAIPYRSLVPPKTACTNLLTPTCLSSSHMAYGAIRLEWTFMLLGQATGLAASLCLDQAVAVQDLPYPILETALLREAQILTPPNNKCQ
jgi:hypothetical protein